MTSSAPVHLAPSDALAGQIGSQRQREHHADDLDRLHDDQAPESERSCLHPEPGQHDHDAEQPQRPLREAGKEPRGELGVAGPPIPPFCWMTVPSAYRKAAPSASRTAAMAAHTIPLALGPSVRPRDEGWGPIKILYGVIGEGLGHATRSRSSPSI